MICSGKTLLLTVLLLMMSSCKKVEKGALVQVDERESEASIVVFSEAEGVWAQSPPVYQNGEEAQLLAILESLGGGVGVLDYDRDGRDDLIFPQGGTLVGNTVSGLPSRLERCVGIRFVSVANDAGLAVAKHYSHGCAVGDFDNDGFADCLISGYGGITVWKNMGDGTFTDFTSDSSIDDVQWSSSVGWGDVDGDGNLDAYLAHYVNWSIENNPPCTGPNGNPDVCAPRQFDGLNDALYLSNGDGTFRNGTESCGVVAGGKGLGVLLSDFDHDSDLDIYVANDTTDNLMYLNDGTGKLSEVGVLSGTAVDDQANANGSMGLAVNDFNNDAHSDIWVTNYESEVSALYQGNHDASFQHVSARLGLKVLGQLYVGFGCVSGDFDLDGDEDFAITNGHVVNEPRNAPVLQKPLVIMNDNHQRLEQLEPVPGTWLDTPARGRGLATFDFNDDGLLDFACSYSEQPAKVVVNESTTGGTSIRLCLVGTTSNRNAIGTQVQLLDKQDQPMMTRWLYGGGSYLSASSQRIHFGVEDVSKISKLQVRWPDGTTQECRPAQFENGMFNENVHVIVQTPAETSATVLSLKNAQ